MNAIVEGNPAPDFEASATGEKAVKLADLKGNNVILYFYPKDDTPGCTLEGLGFRDKFAEFQGLDCTILGVSRDSLGSHDKFRAKHELPFDLLSDPDEKLCLLYDVIKMKNMYGKQVRGIERSTFLIDKQGNLAHQWRKVKVKTHIEEVLEKARELQSA